MVNNSWLHLGKASHKSSVRLTVKNASASLAGFTESKCTKMPHSTNWNFALFLKKETLPSDGISILFNLQAEKCDEENEDETILYKLSVYKLSNTSSTAETEEQLIWSSGDEYQELIVSQPSHYRFANYPIFCGGPIPLSKITVDDQIDIRGVVEEVFTLKDIRIRQNLTGNLNYLTTLVDMYADDTFKDIKFVIGDKSLMAHKAVLVAKSKVFRAMLTTNMKESQNGIVEIDDTHFEAFESFIKFLYSNKIGNIQELGLDLLHLSDKYDVQDLKDRCGNYLSQRLDKGNVIDYLIKADQYNCEVLKSNALRVVKFLLKDCHNFNALYKIPSLLDEIFGLFDQEVNSQSPSPKRRKLGDSEEETSNSENESQD